MNPKEWLPGLLAATGVIILTPLLLSGLARLGRPLAKEVVRFYFDLQDAVQEAVAEHREEHKPALRRLLVQGAEELAINAVEEEAEESVAEVLAEGVAAIAEVL